MLTYMESVSRRSVLCFQGFHAGHKLSPSEHRPSSIQADLSPETDKINLHTMLLNA
jgi:hypothetical protein